MAKRVLILAGIVAVTMGLAPVVAHADDATPPLMADQCKTCHGPDGKGSEDIPALTGLDAATIEQQLLAFRDGDTDATVMDRVTAGFSDAEISAIAAEIATWN